MRLFTPPDQAVARQKAQSFRQSFARCGARPSRKLAVDYACSTGRNRTTELVRWNSNVVFDSGESVMAVSDNAQNLGRVG